MSFFFFFNDTATTEIYTLSLHDALPIFAEVVRRFLRTPSFLVRYFDDLGAAHAPKVFARAIERDDLGDRKSTRLNSSHVRISYAVFCLKKKKLSFSCDDHQPTLSNNNSS